MWLLHAQGNSVANMAANSAVLPWALLEQWSCLRWSYLQGKGATMQNSSCVPLNIRWRMGSKKQGHSWCGWINYIGLAQSFKNALVDEANKKGSPRELGKLARARESSSHDSCRKHVFSSHCEEGILSQFHSIYWINRCALYTGGTLCVFSGILPFAGQCDWLYTGATYGLESTVFFSDIIYWNTQRKRGPFFNITALEWKTFNKIEVKPHFSLST